MDTTSLKHYEINAFRTKGKIIFLLFNQQILLKYIIFKLMLKIFVFIHTFLIRKQINHSNYVLIIYKYSAIFILKNTKGSLRLISAVYKASKVMSQW